MLKGLHHNACRCRDSEQKRQFYAAFLGLPLVHALRIAETKSGRATHTLRSFKAMDDGSRLAFFEDAKRAFEFKDAHDDDLHIALGVSRQDLHPMVAKGKAACIQTRGIADHGFIDSIDFRAAHGDVIERSAQRSGHDAQMQAARPHARQQLAPWQQHQARA
jgi:catechol 2,3-dioxygenase-like lactoylglutathione lyase family enzyme